MRPTPPGLIEAYRSGLPIRATGKQFGLSYNVTRRMLLDAGIGLRSRGQEPASGVRP
ncbi:helix-turn-helix domain-containing protein [Amycolatopsis sp. CA-126428]|uniref:helix-turn-helix domain-containing protein n=1 Tax=Amycolatopsis sp. CA-126428 TaxID=2073158 RepID=UPI003F8CFD2A